MRSNNATVRSHLFFDEARREAVGLGIGTHLFVGWILRNINVGRLSTLALTAGHDNIDTARLELALVHALLVGLHIGELSLALLRLSKNSIESRVSLLTH